MHLKRFSCANVNFVYMWAVALIWRLSSANGDSSSIFNFCRKATFSSRSNNSWKYSNDTFQPTVSSLIGPYACNYIVVFGRNAHTRACTLKWREKETPTTSAAPTTGCEQLICVPNLFKETFHTALLLSHLNMGIHLNANACVHSMMRSVDKWLLYMLSYGIEHYPKQESVLWNIWCVISL